MENMGRRAWRARERGRRWLLAEVQRLLNADAHGWIAERRRIQWCNNGQASHKLA
jgi:hypothetical protein